MASWSIQPFGDNGHEVKIGGFCPFLRRGAGSPSNTMSLGPRATCIPSVILIHPAVWPYQSWAENWGLCPLFGEGQLGAHPTQSRLGRGLPSYQVASWSIQPFGRNRYGPKIGGCVPSEEGELGPCLTQCGQRRGLPACQISSWSIQLFDHSTPTLQTGQDNGPIAQGEPFYKWSPKNTTIFISAHFFDYSCQLVCCESLSWT